MNKVLQNTISKREKERKSKKRWIAAVVSLSAAIAITTSYLLINPATTQEEKTYCGFEEHVEHVDACYGKTLVCELTEEDGSHQHTEDCYAIDYDHPVCELPVHKHTLQCFSDPEADAESSSVWEQTFAGVEFSGDPNKDAAQIAKTQLGYTESTKNYTVLDDGATLNGYTRFGDWGGNPYGDWNVTFCAFCLQYAGADKLLPADASCAEWVEILGAPEQNLYYAADAYTPVPGDLIFIDSDPFDPEHPEDRVADRVGFVTELIYEEGTGEDGTQKTPREIKTVEGDVDNAVRSFTYALNDSRILGYGKPSESLQQLTVESLPASDGAVAVISGMLPENAQAEITAIPLNAEELVTYFGAEKASRMTGYVAYDIKITVDGEEWQPNETVSVTVRHPELEMDGGNELNLAHVEDGTGNVTDVEVQKNADGDVIFDADGFSLYIFYTSFTVDFCYEDSLYSINGLDSILLGDLFEELGIDKNAADAVLVTFTDETLVSVEQNEAGEWMLVSLKPFETNEALTVTFGDGTEIVIDVTDAISVTSTTVSWAGGSVRIQVKVSRKGSDPNTASLNYSFSGSSGSPCILATTPTFSSTATATGYLSEDTVPGDETLTGITVGSTTVANSMTALLGMIPRPSTQTVSFSTWLSSYTGAKTTTSELLEAYGRYDAGQNPSGSNVTLPTGLTITWNDTNRQAKLEYNWTTRDGGTKILQYKGNDLSWHDLTSVNVEATTTTTPTRSAKLTWIFADGNETTPLLSDGVRGIRVWHSYLSTQRTEQSFYIVDRTNTDGEAALLNHISVDVSNFGYGPGNDVFTSWLHDFYLGKAAYGSPDHLPETQKELADAFHYFYSGKDKNGNWVNPEIFNPEITYSESAPELTPPDYGDMVDHYVTKKIDWLGNNGISGMDDFYRLYLGFGTEVKPVDVLLVVDQSGSMRQTLSGGYANDKDDNPDNDSRQSILLKFLDGEPLTWGENGLPTSRAGGFIQSFLGTAEEPTGNNLAIVTFGSDSSTGDTRYIRHWDSTEYFSGLTEDATTLNAATNYAAALSAADVIWDDHDRVLHNDHPKLMIFLSDGEPTLGYSDGQMHTGYLDDKNGVFTVGNGDSGAYEYYEFLGYGIYEVKYIFANYLSAAYKDAQAVAGGEDSSYNQNRMKMGQEIGFPDDSGLDSQNSNFWAMSPNGTFPSFPLMADIRDVDVNVPGLSSLTGGFVDENGDPDSDASTFLAWYSSLNEDEKHNWVTGGIVNGEWENSHVDAMTVYDLFELSKSAFYQFQDNNSGVMTYTIGFGDSISGTYADGVTGKDDVLKYMVGEQGVPTEECTRFWHCGDTETLMDAFEEITKMSGIVMTDILSDNVAPAADPSVLDLDITFTSGSGDPVVLMNGGSLTAAGTELLDMSSGATGFTTVDDKTYLKVVFKEDVIFTEDVKVEAAFTVKTTEAAVDAYENNGKVYPDTGDINSKGATNAEKYITDYDSREGYITSSGMGGLYSNDETFGDEVTGVKWKHMGQQSDAFPKPVVQLVGNEPIDPTEPPPAPGYADSDALPELKKQIDYLGKNGIVGTEDLYRLYLDLELTPAPLDVLLVLDQSGSMANDMEGDEKLIEISGTIDYSDTEDFELKEDWDCYEFKYKDGNIYSTYDDEFDDGIDIEYKVKYCDTDELDFEWNEDEWFFVYEDENGYFYYAWADDDDDIDTSYIEIYYGDIYDDYCIGDGWYDDNEGKYRLEFWEELNPAFSDTNRQEVLMEFLNGKEADHSDGFIKMFRDIHEDNHLAILTFSGDCSDSRIIMPWDSTAVSIDDPPDPEGATNYSAALDIASQVLAQEADCTNRKIMIFLSDGVPTIAYSDGHMQHSYENGNVIGSGIDYVDHSFLDEVKEYIGIAYQERNSFSASINRSVLRGDIENEDKFDDAGNAFAHGRFFSTADVTGDFFGKTDYGFPRMIDFAGVTIPVPGINGMWGDFTTVEGFDPTENGFYIPDPDSGIYLDVGDYMSADGFITDEHGTGYVFWEWYSTEWSVWSDEQKDAWIAENVTGGVEYDLFYLTENSFLDFRQACHDVAVYTIGFSASDFNTLPSGRSGDEVLKYMAGDVGNNPSGRYYNCANEDDLSKVILDIASISGVSIIDPLTEYVDLSEAPKLEITMTLGEGTGAVTKTLYGYDSVQEKYDFTADGRYYLDTAKTKFDADGTLHVVFKPEHRFFERFYCETSFEVRVNAYAAEEYVNNGYNAAGDENTDRPGNNTSSLKPGFFSNDEAIAKWTFGVEDQGEYPNPVVQVTTLDISLDKIDADSSSRLKGAEFDLYWELSRAYENCITYTDTNGDAHYLWKVNGDTLVSEKNASIEVKKITAGRYYLVETKAPDGYILLDSPLVFDVSKSKITLSAGETNAELDDDDTLLLKIKNSSGYLFPSTGGSGTETIYVIGALFMFGAVMIGHIVWRRHERRSSI